MKARLHAGAGALALATVITELFLDPAAVVRAKRAIVYALCLFLPVMALTGASGFALGRRRQGALLEQKKKNMRVIALTGLGVLLPAAFFLLHKAELGQFDAGFYVVQLIELLAGANNLRLMCLNMRDGLRLAGRLRPPAQT